MLRRERRRGGRGDRAKEEAASGWRHRRWLHWHRRRETLQFLLLFFFTVRDGLFFLLSLCFYCPYYFVGAAVRAGTYDFEKILCRAGPGMGKMYFGAGAGRRPGNARPRFQVCHMNVRSAGKTCR